MSFLASAVITARVDPLLLRQAVTNSPTNLLVWLSDALLALQSIRADAFIDADTGEQVAVVDITALGDTIGLEAKWRAPLADYVAWRAFQEDQQSGHHKEDAAEAWARFVAQCKIL